jgi:hypothetical protein
MCEYMSVLPSNEASHHGIHANLASRHPLMPGTFRTCSCHDCAEYITHQLVMLSCIGYRAYTHVALFPLLLRHVCQTIKQGRLRLSAR